jgi:PAS domain S-box-containing protein
MGSKIRNGEGFSVEVINYHKTGRTHWLAIEVQPIRDEEGHIANFTAVESDITARRQHRQACSSTSLR